MFCKKGTLSHPYIHEKHENRFMCTTPYTIWVPSLVFTDADSGIYMYIILNTYWIGKEEKDDMNFILNLFEF